jgi:hypothetical protein
MRHSRSSCEEKRRKIEPGPFNDVDDNPVEAVVYKHQEAAEQLGEEFHRRLSVRSRLDNQIIGQTSDGIKISNMFG